MTMALKRSEMDSHLLMCLSNRSYSDVSTRTAAELRNDWLNWALQDMASVFNWRAMKVVDEDTIRTRTGALWYPLPDDLKDLLDVSYQDGTMSRPLKYLPPEEFRKLIPDPTVYGSGWPFYYTWEGNQLKMWRTPSNTGDAVHLYYVKWPDEFHTGTDEDCPIPRLEQAIIYLAASYGHAAVNNHKLSGQWSQKAVQQMMKLARNDGDPSDYTPQYASQRLTARRGGEGLIVDIIGAGNSLPVATT